MSIAVMPVTRPTLADRLVRRSALADVLLVVAGVVFVALSAQAEVPLWPVPVTGQTLAVLLVGATLGARRGALSMALYLVAGVLGAPVFAGWSGGLASLLRPDFGFIVGFVLSAALMGWFSEREWDRRPLLSALGFGLASAVPFLVGLPWLAVALDRLGLPHGPAAVLAAGFTPFILGGLVKWAIAAAALPLAWRAAHALQRRR